MADSPGLPFEVHVHSYAIGDPCPTCGAPLTRLADAFYWRGDVRDGAYCEPCNSLWAITGEEIPPLRPPDGDEINNHGPMFTAALDAAPTPDPPTA